MSVRDRDWIRLHSGEEGIGPTKPEPRWWLQYESLGVIRVMVCDEPGCSTWARTGTKVVPAKGWWHGHGQDFCPQHNGSDAQRKFADEAQATCPYCGAKFYPETANHRYCKPAHRVSASKRKKKGLPERLPPPWPRWPSPGSGA